MSKYRNLSISVRGADHTEQQALLEDYSVTYECEAFHIAAAAGGGTESQYFRSYLGSRFAAEAALKAAITFASSVSGEELRFDERSRLRMIRQLEGSIIIGWRERVREHLETYPFLDEEIDSIEDEKYRNGYQAGIDLEYAYRSNVMVAITTKDYCLVIRNGSGECTFLWKGGRQEEPVPWNDKCVDGFSTSMCERTAIQEFRHFYAETAPAALFLMTGGMRSCFEQDEEYHEYLNLLARKLYQSPEDVEDYLKAYLPELSKKGTHGDMCLAMIWSLEDLAGLAAEPPEEKPVPEEPPKKEPVEEIKKEPPREEPVRDTKKGSKLPLILVAAAAAAAVGVFLMKGGSSDKETTATTTQQTVAETSLEDLVEKETKDPEAEAKEKAALEESIRESLKEEMAAETATTEEITEEETTPEETEPPETTAAPTKPPKATAAPTQAPKATAAPTTAAPTQPPTTAAPAPETPPAPPPTTAPPAAPADNGSSDLDAALQMWNVVN